MPLRVGIGVGVEVKADEGEAVFPVERDGGLVAGLGLRHQHPGPGGLRRALNGVQQPLPDPTAPPGGVEDADVADPEAAVPALRRALREAQELPALKGAEGHRVLQPGAEKDILKGALLRRGEGQVADWKAVLGSADVVVPVTPVAGGEGPPRVDFSLQAPALHPRSPPESPPPGLRQGRGGMEKCASIDAQRLLYFGGLGLSIAPGEKGGRGEKSGRCPETAAAGLGY